MKFFHFRSGLWLLVICFSLNTRAQTLFDAPELLELRLDGPLHQVIRDRPEARAWYGCVLKGGTGIDTFSVQVDVRARGNFRRKRSTCQFPPLRLKFKDAKNTPFEGQKGLKLVTHCQTRNPSFEQHLLLEYLAYRLYFTLTDTAHRVRLARITYNDTDDRLGSFTRLAFFIEETEDVAKRAGGKLVEPAVVAEEDVRTVAQARLALFAFMIGNTDWSVTGLHNVELVQTSEFSPVTCLPYDFDFSALVGAPYAVPDSRLGQKQLSDRVYRGFCCPETDMGAVVALFKDKKQALLDEVGKVPYLGERERKESEAYLNSFYRILEDEKAFQRLVLERCR